MKQNNSYKVQNLTDEGIIYFVIHRQCFVASQLFSVARHVHLKLWWKPTQFYVSIILLSQQVTYVSLGIIRHHVVTFVCLHFTLLDTRALNSLEELCLMQVAAINSFDIYIYIYTHTHTHKQHTSLTLVSINFPFVK